MTRPTHALVTGATGQLGAALSKQLASRTEQLSLCALDEDGLDRLAAQIRETQGRSPSVAALDVRDAVALEAFVQERHCEAPIDWVVVNAGLGGQIAAGTLLEDPARAIELVDVNLRGVLNTIHACLPLLRERGRGHFIAVSSLSAVIGYDKAPVYAATKAALRVLALSIRPARREFA